MQAPIPSSPQNDNASRGKHNTAQANSSMNRFAEPNKKEGWSLCAMLGFPNQFQLRGRAKKTAKLTNASKRVPVCVCHIFLSPPYSGESFGFVENVSESPFSSKTNQAMLAEIHILQDEPYAKNIHTRIWLWLKTQELGLRRL